MQTVAWLIGLLIPLEALSMWIERRRVVVGQYEPFPRRSVMWGIRRETGERWRIIRLPFLADYQADVYRDRFCWHTAVLVWRESYGWWLDWEPAE